MKTCSKIILDRVTRPAGYKEEIEQAGYQLTHFKWMTLLRKYKLPQSEVREWFELGGNVVAITPPVKRVTGLGDIVHAVAAPIARALRLPCYDRERQQLRPESPCARRRKKLNEKFPL